MTRLIFLFGILWVLGAPRPASAQFEVVSIRPYISQGDPAKERSALDFPPGGRFLAANVTVRKLILEVAKNGFRLQPDTSDAQSRMSENSNGASSMMHATKFPLNALAAALARYLERPVVNKTGISGDYDFDLKWSADAALDPVNPSISRHAAQWLVS